MFGLCRKLKIFFKGLIFDEKSISKFLIKILSSVRKKKFFVLIVESTKSNVFRKDPFSLMNYIFFEPPTKFNNSIYDNS